VAAAADISAGKNPNLSTLGKGKCLQQSRSDCTQMIVSASR